MVRFVFFLLLLFYSVTAFARTKINKSDTDSITQSIASDMMAVDAGPFTMDVQPERRGRIASHWVKPGPPRHGGQL